MEVDTDEAAFAVRDPKTRMLLVVPQRNVIMLLRENVKLDAVSDAERFGTTAFVRWSSARVCAANKPERGTQTRTSFPQIPDPTSSFVGARLPP